jgi:hypothetical protein
MTRESLCNRDWDSIVERLGGAAGLEKSARATKALVRARVIENAVALLRMILAYCLGTQGLRLTSVWATAIGLADISNVGLLYRLRQSGDWLALLVGQALTAGAPTSACGRLIRIIDGTAVAKAGCQTRRRAGLWRIHSAFDLPAERFGAFEVTDEKGGERLDRIAAVAGEIRIADRAFLQPDRMGPILDAGADLVVRAGWRNAKWLGAQGQPMDLRDLFQKGQAGGLIDTPIWLGRKKGKPLAMRLVAVRKPEAAAEAARRKVKAEARRRKHQLCEGTLAAADWVILVTSLAVDDFTATEVLDLYRLRWRIELAFKRLKSLVGLKRPPGVDERSARPWVLAHLLMILLLEPLVDEFENSPRLAYAA